ncbi:putative membrane protein [Acinetobacter baylyi]|uniref:Membrane protein n=2 Tax=Acinetobacter baylyi TaxID=202950 RepID=A0ABU0UTJ0_ACIBI|nr:putative membrane protein [Acinetobacter baylyi]MDR6105063.1 putative membrane protein [Acinetobacter baylyi]MDR6184729.1 putative membrane protein [Acinetobacter baylyi]
MMIAHIIVALIGLLHIYILVLEMFLWDQPRGLKAFGNSVEKARMTKIMAQNQGLYNGFLAAGLFWSLWVDAPLFAMLANFFLGCVLIAGIFGAYTASRKILFIQAIPALIALIFVNMGW